MLPRRSLELLTLLQNLKSYLLEIPFLSHRFSTIQWTNNTFRATVDEELTSTYSMSSVFNQLSEDKILDWSKLKQIADDILK